MRSRSFAALLLACLLAVAGGASAHTPGAPPVAHNGTYELAPYLQVNYSLHLFFNDLGFPMSAGDTLAIDWKVNGGLGPSIDFEIHTHENGSTSYYGPVRLSSLNTTWKVPNSALFMFNFTNPTAYPLNLSFEFVLFAPPQDFSIAFFIMPAAAGIAFGWFLWVRAGRPAGDGDDTSSGDQAPDAPSLDEEE